MASAAQETKDQIGFVCVECGAISYLNEYELGAIVELARKLKEEKDAAQHSPAERP
jgi:hypothetical protein